MAKISKPSIDFSGLKNRVRSQFVGLDPNDPPSWPTLPRYILCLGVILLVILALWVFWLRSSDQELIGEQQRELQLKEDYKAKLVQAINFEVLKKQREQVLLYVTQLEKQLPSKAEMDKLLSDINQAGLGRSLQFELFRPGQVIVKNYYAELPITVRVVGRYHDIGFLAADISNLSRIVTLNNISMTPLKDGNLVMEATAKTFRYLDKDEMALQGRTVGASGAKK